MSKLTIIIPVYNEDKNIVKELYEIENNVTYEHVINIIYDFDEDTTIPVVERERQKYKTEINLIKNKYGRGVLNAIRTGLETAQGKYVVVTMADLSDPPNVINKMVEKAEIDNADIVCASRYMSGGGQSNGPLIKGLMSRGAGLSLHYLARVTTHDATNSFKLYRTSFLKEQIIESTGGFELGLELVVKAHLNDKKISEVPTIWKDREEGQSNFKILQWLPSYLKWYFKAFTKPKTLFSLAAILTAIFFIILMIIFNNCSKIKFSADVTNKSYTDEDTYSIEFVRHDKIKQKQCIFDDYKISARLTYDVDSVKVLNAEDLKLKNMKLDNYDLTSFDDFPVIKTKIIKEHNFIFFIFSLIISLVLSYIIFCFEKIRKIVISLFVFFTLIGIFYINFDWYSSSKLDPSWLWGINKIAQEPSLTFGKDVFFTNGPLGFLTAPVPYGLNLYLSYSYRIFLIVLIIYALYISIKKYRIFDLKSAAIFSLICTIFCTCLSSGWGWVLYMYFFMMLSWFWNAKNKRHFMILYSLMAIFSAIACYIKFTLTTVLGIIFFIYLILTYIYKKSQFKYFVCSFVPVFLLTYTILACCLFNSFNEFLNYNLISLEIAKGYSQAMVYVGECKTLFLGLFLIALYLKLFYDLKKRDKDLFLLSIISVPILFFCFKHSFVSSDHYNIIFEIIPYLFGFIYLLSNNKKRVLCYLIITILTITPVLKYKNLLSIYRNGYFNTVKILNTRQITAQIKDKHNIEMRKLKLPQDVNNIIGNSEVEILPISLIYAEANDWNWSPNPVLQLYSVYTYKLDEISSNHFYTDISPEFILAEQFSIDGRNMFLDTPQTWNTILKNYSLAKKLDEKVLLKRKSVVKEPNFKTIDNGTYSFGEKIEIENYPNGLYGSFDIKENLLGKFITAVFRSSMVYLEVGYKNGSKVTYRVIADNLKAPALVSFIPIDFDDCERLFEEGAKTGNVSYIRFLKYRNYYDNKIKVKWSVKDE